jgi:hypothetical protein
MKKVQYDAYRKDQTRRVPKMPGAKLPFGIAKRGTKKARVMVKTRKQ